MIAPKRVIPVHYNCKFIVQRKKNPADDAWFKTEVEKPGIACDIMKYGDELNV